MENNLEDKKQKAKNAAVKPSSKQDKTNEPSNDLPKGAVLKSIREQKNLSLDTVHEETKIPIDALRAIEEGYTVRTLSPFYYKGFLKIYAQYLNIDVGDVVDDYRPETLPKTVNRNIDDFQGSPFDKVKNNVNKFLTKQRKQQIVIIIGILLVLFTLFKIITFFTNRPAKVTTKPTVAIKKVKIQSTPVVAPVPVVRSAGEGQEPEPIVQAAVVPSAAVVQANRPTSLTAPPTVPGIQKNVILTVRAKKSSWMRVKEDNRVVFQSTLDTGAVETWMADDAIEISGKNINQLEFELNGKMIGSLGRADRKANTIVVTKDGLTVSK